MAAWACDDLGPDHEEGASRCRLRAVELWSEAEEEGEAVVEQARSRCHRGLSGRPEEPFRSLLEFEMELVTNEDTAAQLGLRGGGAVVRTPW